MSRKCFVNGMVVCGDTLMPLDVLIEGGRVSALGGRGEFGALEACEFVECGGCVVLPGVIDAHCHIQLDTGIFRTEDDWLAGTSEAARGGITTVIDFVGPEPGQDLCEALDVRLSQASSGVVDYAFHMTALDASDRTLMGIRRMRECGISSLKIYTTYRPNYYLGDADILKILQCASECGLVTLIHCENDAIVTAEGGRHAGEDILRAYPEMRPGVAEVEAAARMIRLAQYTGARIVIAHNSCARTARLVSAARLEGISVFNETAPQYLFLNAEDNHRSPEPWRYILQPPLRAASDNKGLQEALLFSDVDMVITDHCAYTRAQKTRAGGGIPGGLPGFETLLPMTASVPGMTWPKVAKVLSQNPAKIYGLWPRKGAILPGFDADMVVVRDEEFIVDEARLHSFAQYSPFHGRRARGVVERVFRGGECIVENGAVRAAAGSGTFIKV